MKQGIRDTIPTYERDGRVGMVRIHVPTVLQNLQEREREKERTGEREERENTTPSPFSPSKLNGYSIVFIQRR